MRARAAYIHSFGTTGILVAAALLMLALVGAIVAFKGWPETRDAGRAQPLTIGSPKATAAALRLAPRRVSAPGHGAAARRAGAGRLSTAGLVKDVGAGAPVPAVVKVAPAIPGRPGVASSQPVVSAVPAVPAPPRHAAPPRSSDPDAPAAPIDQQPVSEIEQLVTVLAPGGGAQPVVALPQLPPIPQPQLPQLPIATR